MSKPQRTISDTELSVLKALWTCGPSPVRTLLGQLRSEGVEWAYNTVQTLLQRLLQKGFVTANRRDRAHIFKAELGREQLIAEQLNSLAQRLCDGDQVPLVQSLVGQQFRERDLESFRNLLETLEAERSGPEESNQPPSRR